MSETVELPKADWDRVIHALKEDEAQKQKPAFGEGWAADENPRADVVAQTREKILEQLTETNNL